MSSIPTHYSLFWHFPPRSDALHIIPLISTLTDALLIISTLYHLSNELRIIPTFFALIRHTTRRPDTSPISYTLFIIHCNLMQNASSQSFPALSNKLWHPVTCYLSLTPQRIVLRRTFRHFYTFCRNPTLNSSSWHFPSLSSHYLLFLHFLFPTLTCSSLSWLWPFPTHSVSYQHFFPYLTYNTFFPT